MMKVQVPDATVIAADSAAATGFVDKDLPEPFDAFV